MSRVNAGKECPPQVMCHCDGHRRITSDASDASGEAGSKQGCSDPGPPGRTCGSVARRRGIEDCRGNGPRPYLFSSQIV